MAAQFVANILRLKREGVTLDRDLILALTADEDSGSFNGVDWHEGLEFQYRLITALAQK